MMITNGLWVSLKIRGFSNSAKPDVKGFPSLRVRCMK